MHPECWAYFQKFWCKDNEFSAKWTTLDNAFVNFTHFVRQKEQPHEWSFTKFGLFYAWRRHAAFFMGAQFPCADILIPVAYAGPDNKITPETVSVMLISVKNHFGKKHDLVTKDYLDEELVLGTPNAAGKYLKPDSKATLLLSLRTLPFILPENQNGSSGDNSHSNTPANRWIKFTESNPYIAFVMSIGSGDIEPKPKRFVPESQVFLF